MNQVDVVNGARTALDEPAVVRVVERVLAAEHVAGAELAVEFVGERRMRALNARYRGADAVTDVLAFPLEDPAGFREAGGPARGGAGDACGSAPPRLLGDVVICSRQALRQARASGLPAAFELALLVVHGTLHLLGYDHETDAGAMALRQAEILETAEWEALLVASPR